MEKGDKTEAMGKKNSDLKCSHFILHNLYFEKLDHLFGKRGTCKNNGKKK